MKRVKVGENKYLVTKEMATTIGEFFAEKLTTGEWDIFEVHTENDLCHNGFKVVGATKELPGVYLVEECPICDGKGEAMFSCCTGDRVDEDYGRCPSCKEGLGESECEDCQGTGLVKVSDNVKPGIILDPISQAELWADEKRGR